MPMSFNGDRLGQVSGLIHVATAANGNVVGKQLEGNRLEDRQKEVVGWRNFDVVIRGFDGFFVKRSHQGNDNAVAGLHLLDVAERLFVELDGSRVVDIAGGNNND